MQTAPRLAFIDALKALTAQLIVLHHLSFYGPISEAAQALWPTLLDYLRKDARIAVQVFLVVSGFLAAKNLAPQGVLIGQAPLALLKKRYLKLVLPYLVAVLLCIISATLARQWMSNPAIPDPPSLQQLLAHIFLLHSIADLDSLSAGAWYIAIDFQLFALFLGVLCIAQAQKQPHKVATLFMLLSALTLSALFYFNRLAIWDVWAVYFFAAYGLGIFSYYLSAWRAKPINAGLITAIVALALTLDFRSRILVALCTALSLGIAQRINTLESWPKSAVLAYLGKISYAVFLTHFSVILLANALYTQMELHSALATSAALLLTWLASLICGALFYHGIEKRMKLLINWQRNLPKKLN